MKLIACSDLHFVDTNPKRRIDNYSEILFDKWNYLLAYALDRDIRTIVIAGDVFDTHRASNQLIAKLIKSIYAFDSAIDEDYGISNILTVLGQHDLAFRSESNSPIKILDAANIINIVGPTVAIEYEGEENKYGTFVPSKQIIFHGCSWGEDTPKPAFIKSDKSFNILIIHKMISNKDYWHGNLQYTEALSFLKEQKDYDLIISGDNHSTFYVEYEDRLLINPGSLGRRSIDQVDHKPCFFVYDTDTRAHSQVFIPILPAEQVFDLDAVEDEKIKDEKLAKFVNSLPEYLKKHSQGENVDYFARILERTKTLSDKEVAEIIYECLSGLETSQEK